MDVEDIQKGEPLIFALMVENQLMRPRNWHLKEKLSALDQKFKIINETVKLNVQAGARREFTMRKVDGLNYKDKKQLGGMRESRSCQGDSKCACLGRSVVAVPSH